MIQATATAVLAPFEIWEAMLDNSTIKFFEPLIVKPKVLPPEEPDDATYWLVEVPELMISTSGDEYHTIRNGVLSDIRDAWKHIVCIPDDDLSPNGRKVKRNYLAIAEEICDE